MSQADLAQDESQERRIFQVSQLLTGLSQLLEDEVGRVWVVGEVSNLHRAVSGHSYFTLKADRGQIRAALFRSAASRARFALAEGPWGLGQVLRWSCTRKGLGTPGRAEVRRGA